MRQSRATVESDPVAVFKICPLRYLSRHAVRFRISRRIASSRLDRLNPVIVRKACASSPLPLVLRLMVILWTTAQRMCVFHAMDNDDSKECCSATRKYVVF